MRFEMNCVDQFNKKMGVLRRARLAELPPLPAMLAACEELQEVAREIETSGKIGQDPRWLRLHLELEELAEKFAALAVCDEVAALDGAADQQYVALGTAAIFDWPLAAAFGEVHASNMTKERQPDDPSAGRVRQKGPNYRPPDVAGILDKHRRGDREKSAFRQQLDAGLEARRAANARLEEKNENEA